LTDPAERLKFFESSSHTTNQVCPFFRSSLCFILSSHFLSFLAISHQSIDPLFSHSKPTATHLLLFSLAFRTSSTFLLVCIANFNCFPCFFSLFLLLFFLFCSTVPCFFSTLSSSVFCSFCHSSFFLVFFQRILPISVRENCCAIHEFVKA
jgi:hypothetical protein